MFTPETRPKSWRVNAALAGPQRVSLSSGSEVPFSAADIVESIAYYYENASNIALPADASSTSKQVAFETISTWRLLLELWRMEALAERVSEQIIEEDFNPIRDAFLHFPSFRRLIGLTRWVHWVNAEVASPTCTSDALLSKQAYPHTSGGEDEIALDTPLRTPGHVQKKDLERERLLCQAIWQLLSQGKVADAIDLCCEAGHSWRGAILNASSCHPLLTGGDEQASAGADWVESSIIATSLGFDSATHPEALHNRYMVKRTARSILTSANGPSGIDDFDTAIIAYLCGQEAEMRSVTGTSFTHNLWASLHCLKEEFVAHILKQSLGGRFDLVDPAELETALSQELGLIFSLDTQDEFHQLQIDLACAAYPEAMHILIQWQKDICMHGKEVNLDVCSPSADQTSAFVVRSLAASLATVLRDMLARNCTFSPGTVSRIIKGNIESVMVQVRHSDTLLENNQVVVENLSLLADDFEARKDMWVWYLKQYVEDEPVWGEWTRDNSIGFPPIISLIESFPGGLVPVLATFVSEVIEGHIGHILSHSFGTSISAGRDLSFAIGCLNSVWLTVQSAAKSTGNGIYLDVLSSVESPDEAASGLLKLLGNMIGEALMVLVLADLHAARHVIEMTKSTPTTGHKLMSIQAALDSIHDETDTNIDVLGVVSSFVQLLERVTTVMDRYSLLEQQKAHLPKLTARIRPTSGQSVASSTDARRQVMEAQRMIDMSTESISKIGDEILHSMQAILQGDACPVNISQTHLGMSHDVFIKVVTAFIDVVAESSVQALALVNDRNRHAQIADSMRKSKWLQALLTSKRIREILQEIS
jgi:hypothetical protein